MDQEKLHNIRHSVAHMMAAAVLDLYPGTKLAIGPVIENGFYYDFEFPEGVKISDSDLKAIEKKMKHFIKQGHNFVRKELSAKEAKKQEKGEKFKLEMIDEIGKRGEKITFYESGPFSDLCIGPHVENSKEIPLDGIKLHKIAGAYWRGDENKEMLTRIYGLVFATKKELDDYLFLLEEAKRRDHRKLGKELDLFTFSDLVGKGLPLWTHYGATIRRELENFVIEEELKRGYLHVVTPELAKVDLYRKSGHYPYYKDTMYPPMQIDEEELILRPMTCPHHFMLFSDKKRSYRELPMRIAELARLFRYEKSGELTGMLRVRSFCLADAHIVCMESQVKDEIKGVLELIEFIAGKLGLKKGEDFSYRLSLGDRENTEKYYKNDQGWETGEDTLRKTLQELNAPFTEAKDEAAFYGPKIDIQMKNVLGKEDTAFTVQYDCCLPDRFELAYTDKDGKEKRPVVIHRSSIGAIERTFGFLIERYVGAFPLWLAPIQVQFVPVSEKHVAGAWKLAEEFKAVGIRVEVDESDETVGNKVRKAVAKKPPYILVVGDKELSGEDMMVRVRGPVSALALAGKKAAPGKQEEQEKISKEKFIARLKEEIQDKTI